MPIPYFIRKDTGEILMNQSIVRHVKDVLLNNGGSDAWYKLPVFDLLPSEYKEQADKYMKGNEVFDVWFDNALTWNFVLNEQDYHENNELTLDINSKINSIDSSHAS